MKFSVHSISSDAKTLYPQSKFSSAREKGPKAFHLIKFLLLKMIRISVDFNGLFCLFLWCHEVKLRQTVCGTVAQNLLSVTNYIQKKKHFSGITPADNVARQRPTHRTAVPHLFNTWKSLLVLWIPLESVGISARLHTRLANLISPLRFSNCVLLHLGCRSRCTRSFGCRRFCGVLMLSFSPFNVLCLLSAAGRAHPSWRSERGHSAVRKCWHLSRRKRSVKLSKECLSGYVELKVPGAAIHLSLLYKFPCV